MPNNFKICSARPLKFSNFLFGINQSFRNFSQIVPKKVLHNQQMWVIEHTRVISHLNMRMHLTYNEALYSVGTTWRWIYLMASFRDWLYWSEYVHGDLLLLYHIMYTICVRMQCSLVLFCNVRFFFLFLWQCIFRIFFSIDYVLSLTTLPRKSFGEKSHILYNKWSSIFF